MKTIPSIDLQDFFSDFVRRCDKVWERVGTVHRCRNFYLSLLILTTASTAGSQTAVNRTTDVVRASIRLESKIYSAGAASNISSLAVAERNVLISDLGVSPHFTVLDANSGALVAKMAMHGTLAGQYQYPSCIRSLPGTPSQISFVDMVERKLFTATIGAKGNAVIREDRWPNVTPECAFRFGNLVLINATFPDRVFYHANVDKNLLEDFIELPPFPNEKGRNSKRVTVNPAGNRVVAAYKYISRLDVFDTTGKRLMIISGPLSTAARMEVAYTGVAATDRLIYAAFSGREAGIEAWSHELHVFAWDGRLVARLSVDQPIEKIAVSPDGAQLFASYDVLGTVAVGRWRLPSLLQDIR